MIDFKKTTKIGIIFILSTQFINTGAMKFFFPEKYKYLNAVAAIKKGDTQEALQFIQKMKDVNYPAIEDPRHKKYLSPLIKITWKKRNITLTKELLTLGASIKYLDFETIAHILFYFCAYNDTDAAILLIKKIKNLIKLRNTYLEEDTFLPHLKMACDKNNTTIAKKLIQIGARPEKRNSYCLSTACQKNNTKLAIELIKVGALCSFDHLHIACQNDNIAMAKVLMLVLRRTKQGHDSNAIQSSLLENCKITLTLVLVLMEITTQYYNEEILRLILTFAKKHNIERLIAETEEKIRCTKKLISEQPTNINFNEKVFNYSFFRKNKSCTISIAIENQTRDRNGRTILQAFNCYKDLLFCSINESIFNIIFNQIIGENYYMISKIEQDLQSLKKIGNAKLYRALWNMSSIYYDITEIPLRSKELINDVPAIRLLHLLPQELINVIISFIGITSFAQYPFAYPQRISSNLIIEDITEEEEEAY